jgi:DNA-binding MarR family transcriptional regulator
MHPSDASSISAAERRRFEAARDAATLRIRLTDLASRVGVTKQAVGQLVDDLAALKMVERVTDPADKRAKRIRFSRRGYGTLMQGLGVLREVENGLGAAIGARRMRQLHETLALVIAALESAG